MGAFFAPKRECALEWGRGGRRGGSVAFDGYMRGRGRRGLRMAVVRRRRWR